MIEYSRQLISNLFSTCQRGGRTQSARAGSGAAVASKADVAPKKSKAKAKSRKEESESEDDDDENDDPDEAIPAVRSLRHALDHRIPIQFYRIICLRAFVALLCDSLTRRPNPNQKKRVEGAASFRTRISHFQKTSPWLYSHENVRISHGANTMNQYSTCSRVWACEIRV